jgi:hypothetical protein
MGAGGGGLWPPSYIVKKCPADCTWSSLICTLYYEMTTLISTEKIQTSAHPYHFLSLMHLLIKTHNF